MDVVILLAEWSKQIGQCLPNPTSSAIFLTKLVLPSFGNHTEITHSRSWGCESDDSRASSVQSMIDGLRLVHINDGSFTRIAAPPGESSAIDLTLCSVDLALHQGLWRVLDDAGGSDHLPILTSL
jgi:hypothetical protein